MIDSGIDYSLPEFRRADGTTRIKSLWDQSLDTAGEEPPGGYGYGREYGAERINEALQAGSEEERLKIVPSGPLRTRDGGGGDRCRDRPGE